MLCLEPLRAVASAIAMMPPDAPSDDLGASWCVQVGGVGVVDGLRGRCWCGQGIVAKTKISIKKKKKKRNQELTVVCGAVAIAAIAILMH